MSAERYEYRGARFEIIRSGLGYHVCDFQPPWLRGSLLGTTRSIGWSALSRRGMVNKMKRTIDRSFRKRQRQGLPTDAEAYIREALSIGITPLPPSDREHVLVS